VFGDEVPVELRGRAAWLKLKRGDVAGATADFRALVAEQPTYYWGWLQLLDAYTTTSDHAGRAAVAEKIVALAPHLPQGHVARGDACLTAGDRAGAKASWGRAAQLSGADAYPLVRLVRAAVEDRDLATAQRWCGRLRAVAGDVALPNEARIAIAMGERRRAVDLFRQACTSRTIAPELVALVHRLAVLAGLGNEALAVLEAVFAEGHPSAGAAVLWALASVERADGRAESWVVRADPASEVTAAVARAIALRLSTRDERRRLRRLVDGLPRSVCDAPDVQNALRHALDRVRKRSPEKQRARTRIGYFLGAAALVAVLIFSMATHHTELVVSPPAGFVGVVILLRLALSKRG
jgi:tetratricopeptide (TPR) repeat protein